MGVNLTGTGAAIGAVVTFLLVAPLNLPGAAELLLAAAGGAVGVIVWIISPLPQHNGGFGLPPARLQKWGWTSEARSSGERNAE